MNDKSSWDKLCALLVQRIKTATTKYRTTWNKHMKGTTTANEDPTGVKIRELISATCIDETAQTALIGLISLLAGREITVPAGEDNFRWFPDMPNLVAIVWNNVDDEGNDYIGVLFPDNKVVELVSEDNQLTVEGDNFDNWNGAGSDEGLRLATSAEIDKWAKKVLDPNYKTTKTLRPVQKLLPSFELLID